MLGGWALFVMALGMGAPLLAVGVASRSLLPKVGPWMEGVKKAFGVMLLAVALWMITPVIPPLAMMLGWAGAAAVLGDLPARDRPAAAQAKGWQRFWKGVGVVLLLAGAAILVGCARRLARPAAAAVDPARPGRRAVMCRSSRR